MWLSNSRRVSTMIALARTGLLWTTVLLLVQSQVRCEAKEFDWSDLGVSLATNPKTSSSAANNLRILVSPQRRMTKSYEFEYTNGTSASGSSGQPNAAQAETSYLIPGAASGTYLAQSVGQLGQPSHSSHSTAYSALSASLASLKNRLSARGVSLSGSLAEANGSNLYPASGSNYGSSLLLDSQHNQLQQTQPQSQQTYLSVAGQPESSVYASSGVHNQSNDNKTIVLAIPAKINFLTDGRSSASKQQQIHLQQQQQQQQSQTQTQPQQLTVLQPTSEQSARAEYPVAKQQIGLLNGQEPSLDQSGALVNPSSEQEQHQYVIVNSPQAQTSVDQSSHHLVSAQGAAVQAPHGEAIYSSVYPAMQQANLGSYQMKYVPTYQPAAAIHQPTVHKVYQPAPIEHPVAPAAYEGEQRYSSCLDTCNSADPRWRKYTVSKYKYCCSRSPQYDSQFEAPSTDKAGDSSSKYADDAYYSYLYRRSRARRSRKSRYSRYRYSAPATTPAQTEEDSADIAGPDSGRQPSGRHHESPYMRYYKSRQTSQQAGESPESPSRDALESTVTAGKYPSKERSYRRGRGRDFDAPVDAQVAHENNEEDGYGQGGSRGSTGYGSGDYAVDNSGRYPAGDLRGPAAAEDEEVRSGYDDTNDSDLAKNPADSSDYSPEQLGGEGQSAEESEPESSASYKYTPRRRKYGKGSRSRRLQVAKEMAKYKKSRKNGRYAKQQQEQHPTGQTNGTDYDSAQSGDQSYHPEPTSGGADDEQQQTYNSQKDSAAANGGDSGDSDAILLANKYKQSLNESTVANLSKTTMHLKEILSLLEKKAHLRANESLAGPSSGLTSTSTPAPTTTTNIYPPQYLGSHYGGSSLPSSFSSEYLTATEMGLKSPYRMEPPNLTSSINSPSISYPSSFSSLTSDTFPLSSYGASQYMGMGQAKHLPMPYPPHHPRKRRVNKNPRYNSNLMMPKHHGPMGVHGASLLHAAGKNALLNNPYYAAALQYPYWYNRGNSPSVTNSYPYKSHHKNPYASLLNGPMSSKLAAAASGALYSDESRYHGYDPISNVASSLRPSTAMRLRPKPFVLQPQVLPIYTRHTILTQPMDVKK